MPSALEEKGERPKPAHAHSLLVIGGGTVHAGPNGNWVAKDSTSKYLREMADRFADCTWLALPEISPVYTAELDHRVRVDTLRLAKIWWPVDWLKTLFLAARHTHVMLFLPIHLGPLAFLIRLVCRRLGVYLSVDYLAAIELKQQEKGRLWAALSRLATELPMRAAHVVIARGRRLADLAGRHAREVWITVPMGHVPSFAQPAGPSHIESSGPVLFIGKLTEGKGLRELLHALKVVRNNLRPDVKCEIAGVGPDAQAFRDLANSLGIHDTVSFLGWIGNGAQLTDLYRRASLVVVPSTFTEGVPRVIDEAIANDISVVATKVGGIPLEYSNGEIVLIEPGDVEGLATAIMSVLTERSTREALHSASAARRHELRSAPSAAHQHYLILTGQNGAPDGAN